MANIIVEADLLDHNTHGLALLPRYLEKIASGSMTTAGESEVHP